MATTAAAAGMKSNVPTNHHPRRLTTGGMGGMGGIGGLDVREISLSENMAGDYSGGCSIGDSLNCCDRSSCKNGPS